MLAAELSGNQLWLYSWSAPWPSSQPASVSCILQLQGFHIAWLCALCFFHLLSRRVVCVACISRRRPSFSPKHLWSWCGLSRRHQKQFFWHHLCRIIAFCLLDLFERVLPFHRRFASLCPTRALAAFQPWHKRFVICNCRCHCHITLQFIHVPRQLSENVRVKVVHLEAY